VAFGIEPFKKFTGDVIGIGCTSSITTKKQLAPFLKSLLEQFAGKLDVCGTGFERGMFFYAGL